MAKVSLRAYNREIETMIDRGQFDEAIAHCRHILKTYPKHLETYRLLGKAYLESKRYGDAVDIFSRILTSVPNDFVAQVGMSIIRDEENNLDEAIWHMERAFETQPSNPAIQGELQRLYARRDGVRPPRIRMTRGALANMYVQGELYPQAISEIKNVLKDDPDRADMQALLARACYKSGLKNEAADVASALLRRYPYSLDANRVLAEILGSDHPESTQTYRQRVFELDPYAAHVLGTIFLSAEVSDAAVNIERLDWNGQPVALQPDWSESRAISLETGEQPDWLDKPVEETSFFGSSESASSAIFGSTAPPPEQPSEFGGIQSAATPVFGSIPPTQPSEDIPDFLRAAGWGAATGAFDESKSAFGEEEAKPAESIEQGDLPEWVRAMKPPESEAPAQPEEELPDWIKTIGIGAIAAKAFDKEEPPAEPQPTGAEDTTQWLSSLEKPPDSGQDNDLSGEVAWLKNLDETDAAHAETQSEEPDWLKSLSVPAAASSTHQVEEPDWLEGLGESPATPAEAKEEVPDWLKGLGTPEPAPSSEEPDWLKGLGEAPSVPAEAPSDESDSLKELGTPEALPSSEEPDWLKGLAETPAAPAEAKADDLDWLDSLGTPEETAPAIGREEPDWLKGLGETPAVPAEAKADDLDWLDSLGTPEEAPPAVSEEKQDWLKGLGEPKPAPSEDQPDWLKGLAMAGGAAAISHFSKEDEPEDKTEPTSISASADSDYLNDLTEEPSRQTPPQSVPSDMDQLGTTEQERDDSFAWLESLAAKQGATEGLLTDPEERLEEEPEWVKQAKGLKSETPATQPPAPVSQPPASLEDLGKSEQDQDDSFAWLENLAAKQGASEGLLTQPEERLEQEPEWVKQAKDLSGQDVPPVAPLEAELAPPPFGEESVTEQPVDEVEAWLQNLEGEDKTSEPEPAADATAIWLKGLDEKETPPAEEPAAPEGTEVPDWMNNIREAPEEESSAIFTSEAELESTWMPPMEEPEPVAESKAEDTLPSWLSELDQEEEQVATPSDADDLPAWLLAEETAPGIPEPTIYSDWQPSEETRQGTVPEELPATPPEPSPIPSVSMEMPEAEAVLEPEQPQVEPEPTPVMEAPLPVPEAQPEPTPLRETGGVVIPTVDPVLGMARNELSRNNIPGALDSYGKLIKKARFLDEVIYDLREALYRYPVDVNLWQSLGDAYMRANRLQDALDAYTKAEELLR